MKKRRFGKKGFTLTELVIVLALLSTVSLLIVSFSSLVSSYSGQINHNLRSVEDVSTLEDAFTVFLRSSDTEDYTVYSGGRTLYSEDNDGNIYTLSFSDGKLTGTTPVGGIINYELTAIKSLSFTVENSSSGIGALVRLDIEYVYTKFGNKTADKDICYFKALRAANHTKGE